MDERIDKVSARLRIGEICTCLSIYIFSENRFWMIVVRIRLECVIFGSTKEVYFGSLGRENRVKCYDAIRFARAFRLVCSAACFVCLLGAGSRAECLWLYNDNHLRCLNRLLTYSRVIMMLWHCRVLCLCDFRFSFTNSVRNDLSYGVVSLSC